MKIIFRVAGDFTAFAAGSGAVATFSALLSFSSEAFEQNIHEQAVTEDGGK